MAAPVIPDTLTVEGKGTLISKETVQQIYAPYGPVSVRLDDSSHGRTSYLVQFQSEEAALGALEATQDRPVLNGIQVNVLRAREHDSFGHSFAQDTLSQGHGGGGGGGQQGGAWPEGRRGRDHNQFYVSIHNIPPNSVWQDFKDLFKGIPGHKFATVTHNGAHAIAGFQTDALRQQAISQFDGYKFTNQRGRTSVLDIRRREVQDLKGISSRRLSPRRSPPPSRPREQAETFEPSPSRSRFRRGGSPNGRRRSRSPDHPRSSSSTTSSASSSSSSRRRSRSRSPRGHAHRSPSPEPTQYPSRPQQQQLPPQPQLVPAAYSQPMPNMGAQGGPMMMMMYPGYGMPMMMPVQSPQLAQPGTSQPTMLGQPQTAGAPGQQQPQMPMMFPQHMLPMVMGPQGYPIPMMPAQPGQPQMPMMMPVMQQPGMPVMQPQPQQQPQQPSQQQQQQGQPQRYDY